ncbi:predicted protein [Aspergillus terreus NIH2624]|uniref:Zn(2)-C6 fungal-type domain-containing protein n=1 Tax=Aspergillus terreus (strain NIH 2624 / FGSC A1156) TaxID=341663 RepID=Q0CC13_ASPTN|nr:uncharacterized protein ATEG_08771 [Aspergillus terreus NIH2624]EAU30903.1 predicted protein [Aspergillus terreus NIH2624]
MVAVPYSTGCRTCIQRRIKCDESRPACRRCERRGIQCPGYQKPLRFIPVTTPAQRERPVDSAITSKPSIVPDQNAPKARPPAKRPLRQQNNVDELVAPDLMQKALTAQGIEVLSFFIDATVPGLYYSYSTRVAVNWMSFARRHAESTLDPFVWSIRSLGTLHLGNQHQDENKIASSRSMYGRALRGLRDLLQNPRSVRSDMTLAIAVMLGFFEMLDGMTTESWLTHSRGISTLFRLRGPEAHRSGFGRTLLVSFKSFIVADALVRGESCFLAEPQWRSVLSQTIIDENARGKGCRLGDLSEQIFVEVTECPGLYARTCGVIRDREPDSAVRQTLLDEIVLCKRRLQSLRQDLESEFPAPLEDRVLKTKADLIALIPVAVAQKLRQFALHGAESALALLDQMIVLVQADARRLSMAPTVSTLPSWDVVPAPSMAPFVPMRTKERLSNRLPAWPDQLALSMGMLAMKDGLPG